MSNTFRDNVSRQTSRYQLDEDHLRGFRTAVKNSTPILALEYASLIIDDLLARVVAVETELQTLKEAPPTATKVAKGRSEASPDVSN